MVAVAPAMQRGLAVPPLVLNGGYKAGPQAQPELAKDEVDRILNGLKLDKNFFLQRLQTTDTAVLRTVHAGHHADGTETMACSPSSPTSAPSTTPGQLTLSPSLCPDAPDSARPSTAQQRKAKAAKARENAKLKRSDQGMNPADFDIYLQEAVMPVLAQSLDSLCRQLNNMDKQGDQLDPKVRDRFNPLTWLAQQLLRRHPKCSRTPRRQALYSNFSSWVDWERGRREMLRRKEIVEEVFMGFNLRGGVQKSTIPQVIRSIDESLCLNGILAKNAEFRKAMDLDKVKWPGEGVESKDTNKGDKKKRKATSKAQFFQGETWNFDTFYRRWAEAISNLDVVPYSAIRQGILAMEKAALQHAEMQEALRLEDEARAAYDQEQLGMKDKYAGLFDKLQANEILRQILDENKILTGDDVRPGDPGFEFEVPPKGEHVALLAQFMVSLGFKDLSAHAEHGEGCWWNSDLALAWTTLQELKEMELADGVVERECLDQVLVQPEDFLELREKVEEEIERIHEEEEGFALPRPEKEKRRQVSGGKDKPSMEKLCQRLGIPMGRLMWLHELFEGFLQKEGCEPVYCDYPTNPATLDKEQMRTLMQEVKPDITEAEFEARFQRIDEDGSGRIEFDEFATWLRQDEVRIGGGGGSKLTFEDLADQYGEDFQLISYLYSLFCDLVPEEEGEDKYPDKPVGLPKAMVRQLVHQVNPSRTDADFEGRYCTVDMEDLGKLEFDEVLEVLDFEEFPKEIRDAAADMSPASPK
eukprot:TRINITY_DN19613_c0_g1_i1.p1 TRINITY_DN19613_c0_g1~~TRINITY_DN19613_c0_g1_i1.p1  ORF type:complete len:755 (+),score=239.98 TRINITY_DN19613_c0_g1_i1:176-2440(+)